MIDRVLIWLDDERPVPKCLDKTFQDLIICRSYKEAITALDVMRYDGSWEIYISFDHDLGTQESGYDVAKYIVEHQIKIKGYRVHSMNPVGVLNITQLLEHYGYKKF